MILVVHPKTDTIRRRLDRYGDVYLLVREGAFLNEPAVLLQALKESECCGGRKYHFQAWFRKSEAEWEPVKD